MPFPSESDGVDDPAFAPLIEAGEGEAEGFELAERALIDHASHGDDHGTSVITRDASDLDEERVGSVYAEADDAEWDDLEDEDDDDFGEDDDDFGEDDDDDED